MKRKIFAGLTAGVMCLGNMVSGNVDGMLVKAGNSYFTDVTYSGISVNDGDVIKGVDVSSVISLEKSGVTFKNKYGQTDDIFAVLKDAGVNCIRVRVWNDPYTSQGKTYGGGGNDVNTAVEIAKRCQKYGLKMMVDFHYSDFWADPQKQDAPKQWKYYNVSQKANAIKDFTYSSLQKIGQTGVKICMVQVGNETTLSMCGETDWQNISTLMNAGSGAVRSYDRDILVAVHMTNPEKSGHYSYLAGQLARYKVDYDVFASSYYPYWHGTMSNLTSVLKDIAETYNKQVMVAENSWLMTSEDSDCFGNTVSDRSSLGNYVSYDISVQGQINEITDVFKAVAAVGPKGIGVCYWEPAWITVGNNYYSNLDIWEKYGSGWAASAAMEYQQDAKYYGGSSVDNQALFDSQGRPLDSLYVFSHIKSDNASSGSGDSSGEKTDLITNPGFEYDGSDTSTPYGWTLNGTTSGDYSKFTVNSEMPRLGTYSVHWYSPNAFSGSYIEKQIKIEKSGKYMFSMYSAGEYSSLNAEIYLNNNKIANGSTSVSAYDIWGKTDVIFDAEANSVIRILISVSGSAGAYGSVDDCSISYLGASDEHHNTQSGEPAVIAGDIDNDGNVSAHDILLLTNYLLSSYTFSSEQLVKADVSGDGSVNICDLVTLKSRILES